MEDYRFGHRIRSYRIEGMIDGKWQELTKGQSIGRMKIDYFDEIEVSKIRLTCENNVGKPLIRKLSAFYVENFVAPKKQALSPYSEWAAVGSWGTEDYAGNEVNLEIDLSKKINLPGQFIVKILPDTNNEIQIITAEVHYQGRKVLDEFVTVKGNEISINRTDMVTEESSTILFVTLKSISPCKGKVQFRPSTIY